MKITKQKLIKIIKEELEATLEGERPEDPGLPQQRTGPDGPSDVGEDYNGKGGNRRTEWRLNGKLHREDGPAIEWASGTKEWYLNGKRHREDGPAVEYIDGSKKYWIDGVRVKPFKKSRRN